MRKGIEERLLRSMEQARDISMGTLAPSRQYERPITARDTAAVPAPRYGKSDIVRIRRALRLSQTSFAAGLNVTPSTVRSWEQGIRAPDGAARRLLQVVESSPEVIYGFLVPRTAPQHVAERSRKT
jgi:putative transcriptional regulator